MIHAWDRLSINEICVDGWGSVELIEQCSKRNIKSVALWRNRVADAGLSNIRAALSHCGVSVSSLCRGGMFTAPTTTLTRLAIDDNLRAIDDAAELGADSLVLVCGPVQERDLALGRAQVRRGLEAIVDTAKSAGVRLAVEPLHPMMVADRSVIVTLGEALELVEDLPGATVGIALDAYHVFWDPGLATMIERASDRIFCYQISDWVLPIEGGLSSRGLPGEGHIDLHGLGRLLLNVGYVGPVEVEVLSDDLWSRAPADALDAVISAYKGLDTA